jgi:long-chain fatty acid transport protein
MKRTLLLLPLTAMLNAPAEGAGLYLYETGTNDLGLAWPPGPRMPPCNW